MTITETVLYFVAVPVAAVGALALLVFGAAARRTPRYRPGRPFAFSPVWFLSASARGQDRPALTAAPEAEGAVRPAAKKGGARGTW